MAYAFIYSMAFWATFAASLFFGHTVLEAVFFGFVCMAAVLLEDYHILSREEEEVENEPEEGA